MEVRSLIRVSVLKQSSVSQSRVTRQPLNYCVPLLL
jgi:hypothetical protein